MQRSFEPAASKRLKTCKVAVWVPWWGRKPCWFGYKRPCRCHTRWIRLVTMLAHSFLIISNREIGRIFLRPWNSCSFGRERERVIKRAKLLSVVSQLQQLVAQVFHRVLWCPSCDARQRSIKISHNDDSSSSLCVNYCPSLCRVHDIFCRRKLQRFRIMQISLKSCPHIANGSADDGDTIT